METFLKRMLYALLFTKKILFSLIVSFSLFEIVNGGEVDLLNAQKVALNFMNSKVPGTSLLKSAYTATNLELAKTEYIDKAPSYYIFNIANNQGFVIISAENSVQPILGYSLTGQFDVNAKRPEALDSLFATYNKQIRHIRLNNLKASKNVSETWTKLNSTTTMQSKNTQVEVLPLLQTKWNQGCGYNALCPDDAGGPCNKTWAGCVAVSMGQVLKYWNYPSTGTGSKSYNHYKYGTQSADFGNTTYLWGNMSNNSGNAEVSKLLYHLAVSVTMDFGPNGSGAYFSNVQNAVVNYFKYSGNTMCTYKYNYTDANWNALLKQELNEGRPLMYAGGTHAYVLDGYQANDYFHVNWGWGGSYDGYFLINNLKPGSYDFTSSQCAVVGVIPAVNETAIDTSTLFKLTCGVSKIDSTTNGKNQINRYKNSYLQTTGKEKFYSFNTTVAGKLKINLSNLKGKKLKLILLSYPHRDSVLTFGDTTLTIYPAKPRRYYLAVDGLYGDEGSYQITVSCPDMLPDLSVINAKVSPTMVETGQTGVSTEFYVKNYGNSATPASKTILYFSDDKSFTPTDTKLDSISVPALNPGDSVKLSQLINMPAFSEGSHYIYISVDPYNTIGETDEGDNIVPVSIYGLPPSIMDCSTAFALTNITLHFGNTATEGNSNIANYGEMRGYSGKEVIHSLMSNYKGMATVTFSKQTQTGLTCLVLSACNENRLEHVIWGEGSKDTITTLDVPVEKNMMYYFVVDGMQGSNGTYWLKVNMPDSCPAPKILSHGDTTFCADGTVKPMLSATYGFNSYQWYKNGFAVVDANTYYHYPSETGMYQVEVSENGCSAKSNGISVTANITPKPSILFGSTVDSIKANIAADSYEWYYNTVKNSFVTRVIKPAQSGSYSVLAIDKGCRSEMSDNFIFTLTDINSAPFKPLNIGPNPTTGFIYIKSDIEITGIVEIFSPQGIKLLSLTEVRLTNSEIDLSDYIPGIYLVKISTEKQTFVYRVIKR